jgi:hypothetical protein
MKCPVENCQIQCNCVSEYLKHCETHGNKYHTEYPCDKCSDPPFTSHTSFYRHLQEKHKNEENNSTLRLLTCSHCKSKFNNFESFKKHVQKLYPITRISCPCCSSQLFITYGAFYKHFKRYHDINDKKDCRRVITHIEHIESDESLDNTPESNESLDITPESNESSDITPESNESSSDITDAPKITNQTEEPDMLYYYTEKEKVLVDLVTDLMSLNSQHGFSQKGMDGILNLLGKYTKLSNNLSLQLVKQYISMNEEDHCSECVNIPPKFSENHILNQILTNGLIDTHMKRHTIAKKKMNFVADKTIPIGSDITNQCHFAFNPPADMLKRLFQDTTVENSFNAFKETVLNSDGRTKIYGDFFTSKVYEDILQTLSPSERKICGNFPLILGLYR